MNEELNNALEKGENLLWSGGVASFKIFEGQRKGQLLKSIVITLAITIAIIAGYLAAIRSTGADVMPALIIIILLLGLFAAFSIIMDAGKVRKQIYAVTDRRILVLSQGKVSGISYDNLGEYSFVKEASGNTCFIAGSDMARYNEKKLIKFASLSIREAEGGACSSLVLFALNEPELFREAITPFLK